MHRRLLRDVFDNPGNRKVLTMVDGHALPDNVIALLPGGTEEPAGDALADHHPINALQCRSRIAAQEGKRKYIKKSRAYK